MRLRRLAPLMAKGDAGGCPRARLRACADRRSDGARVRDRRGDARQLGSASRRSCQRLPALQRRPEGGRGQPRHVPRIRTAARLMPRAVPAPTPAGRSRPLPRRIGWPIMRATSAAPVAAAAQPAHARQSHTSFLRHGCGHADGRKPARRAPRKIWLQLASGAECRLRLPDQFERPEVAATAICSTASSGYVAQKPGPRRGW